VAFPIPVRRLIAQWEADGLIDRATAAALHEDVAKRRPQFGVGAVLAVLGAVLLGAAILALVAANWQEIPRLLRVGTILVVLWGGYVGGALVAERGAHALAAAFYLVAALAFGGGIALVGQMYNVSGDAADAALLWVGGVLLSALLLRSATLSATGMVVGAAYMVAAASDNSLHSGLYIVVVPFIAAIGWAFAIFTRGRVVRHLSVALIIAFLFTIRVNLGFPSISWAVAAVGAAIVVAEGRWPQKLERATGFGPALAAYCFAASSMALIFEQLAGSFNGDAASLAVGALTLGLAVGALVVSGRRNPGLRWLAYATFSVELIYLAFAAVGSLIGTAGFFLAGGILVLAMAVVVLRLERRFHAGREVEAS
jgi:uncharacterized membrane protein